VTLETPPRSSWSRTPALAWVALRGWTPRQRVVATVATLVVGLLVGYATALVPNPVFSRDIPPVWWNYPVWIATSALSGMLIATYVRSAAPADETRSSGLGLAGGVLAWFAVGCPACNKLALLALGYSGAITWFAPVQPFLGIAALALTAGTLAWRLRGQVACPTPRAAPAENQEATR